VRTSNNANVTNENAPVPRFAAEMGLSYDVHEETIGGQTLDFHIDVALPVIAQAKRDVVVLQEYSTFPLARLALVGDAWLRTIHSGIAEANPYAP